jgi:hypothetical protein
MEEAWFSEALVFYEITTWRYNPVQHDFKFHRRKIAANYKTIHMQFSLVACYILFLGYKYYSQRPVFKHS